VNRVLIGNTGLGTDVEQVAFVHPFLGLLEHQFSVGLRHDALAYPEPPDIDHVHEAIRNFVEQMVLVFLRVSIDIGLGADQRARQCQVNDFPFAVSAGPRRASARP
jgi:hypothetical protein